MSKEHPKICTACGVKHSKIELSGSVVTCTHGECDWCGQAKLVTNYRAYGYPDLPVED